MGGENLYMILELGRSPLCKWNTWDILVHDKKSCIRIMNVQPTAKTRAEPARNPGTPRPGARRHGKRNNTPHNNMIPSVSSKTIYTQLSRAVTRCSAVERMKSIFLQRKCRCETLIRYSHWKENMGYPGWPQACPSVIHLSYSSWKRPLQGNESSAGQIINPGHKTFSSPIGVATRDDPRPAMLAHKSIMQSENIPSEEQSVA